MGNKFDPLEDAKVKDDGGSGSKKKLFKKDKKKAEAAAPPPPKPVAEKAPAPAPAPKKAPVPTIVAKADKDLTKSYRVLKEKMVSVNGSMTRMRVGKVLSARLFGGPIGLARLLEQVEVEEV